MPIAVTAVLKDNGTRRCRLLPTDGTHGGVLFTPDRWLTRRSRKRPVTPDAQANRKELDVLNTGAVILNGVFDLSQLEAIVAHMKALATSD